jgi:histidinol-phosphatase (PHP family)
MINYHAHDDASSDAAGRLVEHARAAAEAGLRELCLTNHVEILGPDGRWTVDADEVIERLGRELEAAEAARSAVPGLTLRVGAELEYRAEWVPALERIAAALPLDVLLGSVHVVDGHNISGGGDVDAYFTERSLEEAYGRYFEVVTEMVAWGGFDVVAHLDLVKRFGHRTYGTWDPRKLEVPIRALLEAVADADLGLEINTSGYAQPPGAPYPDPVIVRWAREAGVPRLTLGADSHAPHRVAAGLDRGAAVAAAAGWASLTGFDGRRPRPVGLPDAGGDGRP